MGGWVAIHVRARVLHMTRDKMPSRDLASERDQLVKSNALLPRTLPKAFATLDVPRLVGCFHIVFFHFLSRPDEGLGPGAAWGTSWVSFFLRCRALVQRTPK